MASTTMDAIGGGAVDDSNVACSSLWPLAVGNNMAVDSMAPDNFANHHSPEGYNHSGHAHDSFTSGNNVSVDDAGGADAHAHDTPAHQAPEDYVHVGYFVNGHIVDQDTPDIYIGPGDASDKSQSESFMSFDGAGGYHTAAPDNSQRHAITIIDNLSENQRPIIQTFVGTAPKQTAPTEMHKFMQFPVEIRLMIWEMAIADANKCHHPYPIRSVQRFRFNLAYDARRVKPGQDKSRGWVACFTPLRINTNPPLVFLRAAVECRAILLREMSVLTVHELPVDQNGKKMAPRKCHMPFDFTKDEFCLESITHGLNEATKDKGDKDAVWDPEELPLADLLDNALGLRFAPRIKRLAIIPHCVDIFDPHPCNFMGTANGRNMATLAKRFPALVTIKSAIPQKTRNTGGVPHFSHPGYIVWKAASLRGQGKGGPSRMSEGDRQALYVAAWRRIFDSQYWICHRDLILDLFDDCGCLV